MLMSCVVYISNKTEYPELDKFYQESHIVILSDFCDAINKELYKISFHRHFK